MSKLRSKILGLISDTSPEPSPRKLSPKEVKPKPKPVKKNPKPNPVTINMTESLQKQLTMLKGIQGVNKKK